MFQFAFESPLDKRRLRSRARQCGCRILKRDVTLHSEHAVTRTQRELAQSILQRERELGPKQKLAGRIDVAERVLRRLAPGVTTLVTATGYRSLLARALRLAQVEFPALDAIRIPTSGGYLGRRPASHARATDDGLVSFIANLIALLATFIGDELTGNLIRDAWPDASKQRAAPGSGGTR